MKVWNSKNYIAHLSFVRSGRVMDDDTFADEEGPRYGFYWWFWLPKVKYNGGKFSCQHCVDYGINWLCFHVGLTFYYQGRSLTNEHT